MPDEISEEDLKNMSAEEIAELQKQNCIFCKIAQKQIPAKIMHEDDKVICVLDINPASEGHILVMPKEHYMIMPHIPEDMLGHLFKTVKLMSNTLLRTLQCKGTTVFVANGMAAGQKAPHVLIHVFPRRDGDGLVELPKYEMNDEQLNKLKDSLKPYLNQMLSGKPIINKIEPQDRHEAKKVEHKRAEIDARKDVEKNVDHQKKELITDQEDETRPDETDETDDVVKETKPKRHPRDIVKDADKQKSKVNLDDISKLFGA